MKSLNKKAEAVLNKLETLMNDNYVKVDNTNGTFMPVVVEDVTFQYPAELGRFLSVAHYYEQNGDLMADPEMIFLKARDNKYYPIYTKMDAVGFVRETVLFESGTIKGFYKDSQRDQVQFANMWMTNIKHQQGL